MNLGKYNKFVKILENNLTNIESNYSNIIILCIGTENIIGDSVGPIIGSNIKKLENEIIKIYGCIGENLDFSNTKKIVEQIYKTYINPFIITIDAALSKQKREGEIYISNGYIKIGNALEKSICFYSNVNIKCIVGKYNNINKKDNINVLNNVSKEEIYNIVEIVSKGVKNVLKNMELYV